MPGPLFRTSSGPVYEQIDPDLHHIVFEMYKEFPPPARATVKLADRTIPETPYPREDMDNVTGLPKPTSTTPKSEKMEYLKHYVYEIEDTWFVKILEMDDDDNMIHQRWHTTVKSPQWGYKRGGKAKDVLTLDRVWKQYVRDEKVMAMWEEMDEDI